MELNQDFYEFLKLLAKHEVRYLDFLEPDIVVQLGYPPQRIDMLTSPDGVTFDGCWPDRLLVGVGDLQVPVLGLAGLIANKTAAGRDQDLVDVTVLRRLTGRRDHGDR